MMAHMMRHKETSCAKGAMECPMMKSGKAPGSGMGDMKHSPSNLARVPDKAVYTCPMHPEVQKPEPGKCPKCSMNLEKKPS